MALRTGPSKSPLLEVHVARETQEVSPDIIEVQHDVVPNRLTQNGQTRQGPVMLRGHLRRWRNEALARTLEERTLG